MKNKKWYAFGALLLALVAIGASYQFSNAHTTSENPLMTARYRNYQFFASSTSAFQLANTATTTSATSTDITPFNTDYGMDYGYFVIQGAKKVSLYFSRGGATSPNTGTSTFSVQVTPDGTNWYNFSKLVQSTSTVLQASTQIEAATSTQIFGMDLTHDTYYAIRCIVLETIDGEHTCKASAEW